MERLGITGKFQIPRDRPALFVVPEQFPKIIRYGFLKPKKERGQQEVTCTE